MSTATGSPSSSNNAAIYCRISADPEGERAGVERQARECAELADRLGLTVVNLFEDNDVSAYSGKPRPEFERLLADAQDGQFDHVIAWASDRLYRRLADLTRITDELAGVTIHTVAGGEVDLSSAEGIMRAQVLGSMGEFESRRRGERLRAASKSRAAGGVMTASRLPFGWQWRDPCPAGEQCQHGTRCEVAGVRSRAGSRAGLIVNPLEAEALAQAYAGIAAGLTLAAVSKAMRATGLPRAAASPAILREQLLAPRHAGLVSHRGVLVAEASDGQAIVSRERWEVVNRILNDPSRRTSPGRPAGTWFGGGILRCGICRNSNLAGGRKRGGRTYTCTRNQCTHAVRAPIDEVLASMIGEVLVTVADAGLLALPDADADAAAQVLHQQCSDLEGRLEALAALAATGELDPADYASAARRIRAELADAAKRLAKRTRRPHLAAVLGHADGVTAGWAAAREKAAAGDVAGVRGVAGELLQSAYLHRGGRIELHWHDWLGEGLPPEIHTQHGDHARAQRQAEVRRLTAEGWSQVAIRTHLGIAISTIRRDLGLIERGPRREKVVAK